MNLPSKCKLIYQPKGRAGEYAKFACNIYRGCDHACTYCYGPGVTHKSRENFANSTTRAASFMETLTREAALCAEAGITEKILLCFTCDPYQRLDRNLGLTRRVIQILKSVGLNVQILTKGGGASLRDLDLLTPLDAYATTLTFTDTSHGRQLSSEWEPGAAWPAERMGALRAYHAAGIPTWVSLEPVIEPKESLALIEAVADCADHFKVGKLNYHPAAKGINWRGFAVAAIQRLEALGKSYYIKADLAKYLGRNEGYWGIEPRPAPVPLPPVPDSADGTEVRPCE